MALLSIPFQNYPSFREDIVLESVRYTFAFHWNSIGSFWSMDITNNDLDTTVYGIRLVINSELLSFVDRGLPPGNLVVIDQSGDVRSIEKDDFINERLDLIYVETSDPNYSGSKSSSNQEQTFVIPILLMTSSSSFLQFGNMRFVAINNEAVLERKDSEVWTDTGTHLG